MSAAVISFGGELRIPPTGSPRLNESASWAASSAVVPASDSGDDPVACYETAGEPELVSAAKVGDERAFMELCHRHTPTLKRRIRRIVRNHEDAEDVLQETLIRAFSHVAAFRGQCSFRTWIMTIATNNSLMLLRKRRNHPETGFGLISADGKEVEVLHLSDPMPNPEQQYARRQACHRVSQAVKMLPPGFRVIVERYHQQEVKLVDAANSIGISEAAAKSRLMRARVALRRTLKRS